MTTKPLSEKRKADRQEMTLRVEELVARLGCKSTRRENDTYPGPHRVHINIEAPRGLCVTVEFAKDSWQPDVHVLSWHISGRRKSTLSPATFGLSVNPHHFQKATSVAYGFDGLMAELERCLTLAVTGEAFREPAEVLEPETA